ncbi:MAG TPA: hypothetical protein VF800_15160 [Telluria sp.]|jgi:hypothetical protein
MRESLLTPSLSPSAAPAANLYSVQSGFLVAFFGGPFAIILYSALNSWKLKRPLEALAYLGALALSAAFLIAVTTGNLSLAWLARLIGNSAGEVAWRALSMTLFCLFYLMHSKQHRSAALFGAKTPSPWIPGIACAVLAHGLTLAILHFLKAYSA